jgi:hypothetical protein
VKACTFITAVVAVLITALVYFKNQNGQFKHGGGEFGFVLLKDHYRSWIWSFCDGYQYDGAKWKAVVIDDKKHTIRFGYRWIPKYRHLDMSNPSGHQQTER